MEKFTMNSGTRHHCFEDVPLQKPHMNREATIGICAAILRYLKMNLAQKIISLVLYCGHSAKQVQLEVFLFLKPYYYYYAYSGV